MATLHRYQGETDEEVAGLREEVSALRESVRELRSVVEQQSKTIAALSAQLPPVEEEKPAEQEVSPDELLIIAAAVTAFLGKKVRIHSAKMLQSPYEVNPWSQQGRVSVQASHMLRWLE